MQIIDLYSKLRAASADPAARGYALYETDPELKPLRSLARSWEMDVESAREWFATPEGIQKSEVARAFLAEAPTVVRKVEAAFGRELPGLLILAPSYDEFDGFARYDSGAHAVLLGIDFPDADVDYLRALTAHELSHVYRDHSPEVWRHLGKPLAQIRRSEYLEAGTAQEHLVSEGLATLFSQVLYPEIPSHVHHYYEPAEWEWVQSHASDIDRSLLACLRGNADVWSYYGDSRVGPGSPSRTQYYWAAHTLSARLSALADPAARLRALVRLHERPAMEFTEFLP